MAGLVLRVAPLGANWVIRSANDDVILGYPSREMAFRAAERAAEALREQGEAVELVVDAGGGPAAA